MNTRNSLNRFGRELLCYLGWGVACGSVSLGCAWTAGFNKGADLGAMIAGVVTWSVLCAVFTAREAFSERWADGIWGRALRLSLRGRAGLTLVGATMMGLGFSVPALARWWVWTVVPDFIAGAVSSSLTQWMVSGKGDLPAGFFAVYLTTLVQGAWVIGTVLALAGIIRCFLRDSEKAVASQGACSDSAPL